jgi:hypothetical protein
MKPVSEKLVSTAESGFLRALEDWLAMQPEILVEVEFSRTAGGKEFRFFSSFPELSSHLQQLNPQTRVTAFRRPQLPLRGRVDDAFIKMCITHIPNAAEFLVVETVARSAGGYSWFHESAGETHEELRESLEDSRGKPVAVGLYPPQPEVGAEVVCAYVPDHDGVARRGVY